MTSVDSIQCEKIHRYTTCCCTSFAIIYVLSLYLVLIREHNQKYKQGFESESYDYPNFVDVVVQCQMLGEGYDNNKIAISVFLAPPGKDSVGVLSQYHGRAVRLFKMTNVDTSKMAQLKEAHLFYPKWESMMDLVERYRNGEDESTDSLFAQMYNQFEIIA